MLPLSAYKILHIMGILMVIMGLGGVNLHVAKGGTRSDPGRKMAAITHGIGMVLVIAAGFGMLARLDIPGYPWPAWVFAKLAIWLAFGALLSLTSRLPAACKVLWWITLALAVFAAFLGITKPF